jgi:imidazolonepropionase
MVRAFVNCGRIATPRGSRPLSGREMGALFEVDDGVIVVDEDGVILEVGAAPRVKVPEGADIVDAEGLLVVPGLVDPHTHAVFAGDRSFEVEHKVAGKSYLEIQRMGGGIHHTVEATRRASTEELAEGGKRRLTEMLRQGTTTVEVKSGYGLDTHHEVKMLRAVELLRASAVQDVVPTLLAAHAVPKELAKVRDVYVQMVLGEMLPQVAHEGLASFVDVWCDEGAFTPDECRAILVAAQRAGLGLRLHADEFGRAGGARLAADLHASSADHLLRATPEDFRALRDAGVVPVLAPAAPLVTFTHTWPDARALIADAVPFALATDFNPNCQVSSMQRAMALAVFAMRTPPKAALTAATLNAACSLSRGRTVGTIEEGKLADLAFVEARSVDEFVTDLSTNRVHAVARKGAMHYSR